MSRDSNSPVALAFFGAIQRRDVHMGGLLVLDSVALPLAFHHTNPVRPGLVNRLLVGTKDDAHMRGRVLLPPLLNALKTPPSLLLLTDKATFEGLPQQRKDWPPVLLAHEGKGEPLPSKGDNEPQEDGSLLLQLYDVGPPTHLWGDEPAKHAETLLAFARHDDLLEPFHRLEHTLQTLYDDAVRHED